MPIIDPQYYAGQGGDVDFTIMAAAQKFANRICSTALLSNIIKTRVFSPTAESHAKEGDFVGFIRNYRLAPCWYL